MDSIQFRLNDRPIEVGGVAPTVTVLRWLRDTAGLTGTKEGCAEGDCGACTVVIGDPSSPDGKPTWRAVNACLVLLPMLHGRTVWTVEGLNRFGPHPAQEALVRELGSQCGYCTPGVVMSMFEGCYRRDVPSGQSAALDDQMCGNLCRCTGYRPIRDAAASIAGTCPKDAFTQALESATGTKPIAFSQGTQRYFAPRSLPDLFSVLGEHPDHRIVVGATDLGLEVTKKHVRHPCLVSLEAIEELRRIEAIPGGWRIGAAALLSDLEALAQQHCPPLAKMLRYFASRQIKNRATIGGNLCNASPIGDCAPVLIALGASVVLASKAGTRRIPLESFFVGYRKTALKADEILLAIELETPTPNQRDSAFKVSKRRELDISAVAAGMSVTLDAGIVTQARLAYGGMAATPARAAHAEAALVGQPWGRPAIDAAMSALDQDFSPMSDHRGSAWYRSTVAKNLLLAFYEEVGP